MKMLVHRVVTNPNTPFLLDALRLYLRVDHDDDLTLIEGIGITSASEIEHFAQIALLTQTIRVTVFDPATGDCGLRLPIGPAADDAGVSVTVDGQPFMDFEFAGGNRPYIRWLASWHSLQPSRVTIEYEAGFAAEPAGIPVDLAQAIMDQAALHYDGRAPMAAGTMSTSPHMARIAARYRGVSL